MMKKLAITEFESMTDPTGRAIPNQFKIRGKDFVGFKSYNSIIVIIQNGQTYLDGYYWSYSNTTGKYRNKFLGEDRRETEKKIKSGEYILTTLNP